MAVAEPARLAQRVEQFDREGQAVARCVQELEKLGVQVKDLDRGLVDFPALRDGEEVLLCWQVGEDEVRRRGGDAVVVDSP